MTAVDHRLMTMGAPARRVMTLRWEISPRALRRAAVPAVAAMNGQAEKIAAAWLEWRIDEDHASARLVLEIGEDDMVIPVAEAHGNWIIDDASELDHGVFGDALVLSVRGHTPVYVKTRLLDEVLGLGGGVYDIPRSCER